MNDLTEIALNALDSDKYAENESDANDTTNDGADEKDPSNTDDGGDNDADDNGDDTQENTDENDGDDSGDETNDESDDKSEDDSDDKNESDEDDEKENEKKSKDEMTDEEFEELAKKRGYSKKSDDDAKKQAEDDAKRRMDAINAIPKPKELDADTWGAMPPINKVIYSRLPYITVHGKDGDVKIKTPEQLPEEFEFANDKARAQYTNDIQAQETMAQQMANAIQGQAQQQQMAAQRHERAVRIVNEIESLQKDGVLPKPKAQPGTAEFNSDPAVVQINKVLDYQNARAQQGLNLTLRDAVVLYKNEHPDEFKQPEPPKAKGDDERKNVAKKVAGNNKSTNKSAAEESAGNKRKYYRPGMSTQDVLDRALNDLD